MPRSLHALLAYAALTLIVTWPLAAGLGRDVAWDLGDSILNMWILAWVCEQILAILRGDLSRLGTFWDANIFHPAPMTLAYSEHLIPQALQILPLYALTGNPILCYNLLFLSTFVLSAFGTYLFVRELTGNHTAAFVAGLVFGFALYRVAQFPHLQVLSSQWMPFALYGFRRYFDTRRRRYLAGAASALVLQNLSCGYYLLYFPPFAGAYVLWEVGHRRLWRERRIWVQLSAAAAAVLVATIPFLLPYAIVHEQLGVARQLPEVARFSADVHSYLTAAPALTLWGSLQTFPKAEGELFPGIVPLVLALAALVGAALDARAAKAVGTSRWHVPRWLVPVLLAASGVHAACGLAALVLRRFTLDLLLFDIRVSSPGRMLMRAALLFGMTLILSPTVRSRSAAFLRERGFFLLALVAAVWLSLGPLPQAMGRPVQIAAPYRLLFEYVPGFEGLRVPARFAMVAALMIAVLGGYGAALITRARRGHAVALALGALFIVEGLSLPFLVNGVTPVPGYAQPESRLMRPARAPGVYKAIAEQPADAVVAELPIGYPDFDLRAMYYSLAHWRPLVNGYSGFFPPEYGPLAAALSDVPHHPRLAWDTMRGAGVSLVVVHEGSYLEGEGSRTTRVLQSMGAVELYRDGSDVLLSVPR